MMNRKKSVARPASRRAGAQKSRAAKKPAGRQATPARAAKQVSIRKGPARKPVPIARKKAIAKKTAGKKAAAKRMTKSAPPRTAGRPAVKAPAGARTRPGPTRTKPASRPASTRPASTRPASTRPTSTRPASRRSTPRRLPAPARFDAKTLRASFLEIVRRTSADLPADVVRAIEAGRAKEEAGSNASWAMGVIMDNIGMAHELSAPLCQDTGSILFFIRAPRGFDETTITRAATEAVAEATAKGYLRQNSVDSLTGRNSGNNLGPGSPSFHIQQWGATHLEVRVVLKGGGCENVGTQYSLPDSRLGANRDLAGVEKCILDATNQAQGKGCGPGILGVCIGGDRATGYAHSKEQFLRPLDDTNMIPELAALETRVVEEANRLGIGPMGFGGASTLLGCKIGVLNRLPASFFVSISYMCWAYRRQGAVLTPDGSIRDWLY